MRSSTPASVMKTVASAARAIPAMRSPMTAPVP